MADLSDSDVGLGAPAGAPAAAPTELSDADVGLPPGSSGWGWGHAASSAVTDIPSEIAKSAGANWDAIKQGFMPKGGKGSQGVYEGTLATGRALAAIPGLAMSPLTGAARSLLGHPLAQAEHSVGSVINPQVAASDNPQKMYDQAAADAEEAMAAMGPRGGSPVGLRAPTVPVPVAPKPGPFGVTLSEGQETGALPAIQREQAALRGTSGAPAQERAQQFFDQQKAQLAKAGEDVSRSLDPYGAQVAESPQEAGDLVSQGVQNTAAARKAQVGQAYDVARNMPGEIHADVFQDMGSSIKNELTNRAEPVIVDDKLTPYASQALQDVDNRIAQLRIQNRADPLGQPNPNQIVGVNLNGVDQMRKRLSAFRQQAFASGNGADGRAAQAVLDSFDGRIDQAVNGGQFNGDPRAVDAWNAARSAYADYRRTFTAGKNDPVGRVVERIIGNPQNAAAIPNDVADFMYGSSGVNPSGLNVGVANRVKGILGEQSPEWSAVKQGLFSRLSEPTPGMQDWGSAKISQRLNRFLNGDGSELAQAVFSPAERQMLQAYADLHRKLAVPQAGANWSNTATFTAKMLNGIGSRVGMAVGALAGRAALPFAPPLVSEAMGAGAAALVGKAAQATQARAVAKQLPLVAEQMQKWRRAVANANRLNAPPSAAAVTTASANLASALRPLGIEFGAAGAGENQHQNGPSGNQPQGQAQGGAQRGFAHGGRVNPANIDPQPSPAQKRAGNYAKDHVRVHGLDITIENAKGGLRSGVSKDGKRWTVKMPCAYGYIRRAPGGGMTEKFSPIGADGDHVDVYLGPHIKSPKVYVVDQVDASSGRFDEHKVMLGFTSLAQALTAYHKGFSDGRAGDRIGHVTPMTVDAFKGWLERGDTTKAMAA